MKSDRNAEELSKDPQTRIPASRTANSASKIKQMRAPVLSTKLIREFYLTEGHTPAISQAVSELLKSGQLCQSSMVNMRGLLSKHTA